MNNPMAFNIWIALIKTRFAEAEEFELARAIYPFEEDFENGMSPQNSFDKFDALVTCEDAA